jgi:hypothetical protein
MDLHSIDIARLIEKLKKKEQVSQLGFFSKPYTIKLDNEEIVIKVYNPVKNNASFIIQSHDKYIEDLKRTGIKVPNTRISMVKKGSKQQLIILQPAFEKSELVRTIFEVKPLEKLLQFLRLMYNDTIIFWLNNPYKSKLGFHPTLRNYAYSNGSLHYFDTFPPMNMSQHELNKLILQMAPVTNWIKSLIPVKAINRVSNEYYSVEKMIIGILGSSIRLRPEYAEEFLKFTKNYIQESNLTSKEKYSILQKIDAPPRLPFLWRLVRKITGNVGKPNITLPKKT